MCAPGEPAPAFSGRRLDGSTAKLDCLRGKRATLLFFSATSCPFSVKALKPLGDVAKAFNEHGVQIMSPHFEAQPDKAVVVPKAGPPSGGLGAVVNPNPVVGGAMMLLALGTLAGLLFRRRRTAA